ncbi:hypothetical protein CLOM_g19034 [Closterium sp. NIES-68]|nr:hypothetical protein CLOM_g19034 [Closterium sp. NIES-68]
MDPSPSAASYPFFARTIRSDALEMQAIADLVAHFSWLEVITIYSDDDYGRNGVGMMTPGYVWIATEGVVSELENLPELSTEGVIGTRVFVPPNAQLPPSTLSSPMTLSPSSPAASTPSSIPTPPPPPTPPLPLLLFLLATPVQVPWVSLG